MILAIGNRDDFLHVYQNDKELIADKAVGPGPKQFSGPVEFFDSDGRRFAGEHDQQGNLLALNPTADPPDLPALLQRVRNTFDRGRSFMEDHPDDFTEFGPEVKGTLARLPHLSTSAELREFLQIFTSRPPSGNARLASIPVPHPDKDSTWHNWLHKSGIGHG